MKNAPAVTARRATNQIVLAADHQALAATAVVSLPAAAAETLVVIVLVVIVLVVIVLVVIVLAEQTVRVVTTRLIDHVVMAHRLIDRAAMVRLARLAHLETVPIPRGLHAMAIAPIHRARPVTAILGHRVPVAIVPTRRVLRVMVIHVHVVMAMTAHVSLVAMAIRAAGPHVAMVLHLPGRHGPAVIDPIQRVPLVTEILGLRVPGETVPIRRVPRATARVQIVREANGLTVLARIAQIVHAPIALTATSHAVSGSPMGESVVHFARR